MRVLDKPLLYYGRSDLLLPIQLELLHELKAGGRHAQPELLFLEFHAV